MSSKHAQEPWRVHTLQDRVSIFGTHHVASMSYAYTTEETYFNAQRIVKCVNAMESIEDPAEYRKAAIQIAKEHHQFRQLLNLHKKQSERGYRNGWAEETFKKQNPNQTILI